MRTGHGSARRRLPAAAVPSWPSSGGISSRSSAPGGGGGPRRGGAARGARRSAGAWASPWRWLAQIMGATPGRVSQIEHGEASTGEALASYVTALGGKLELIADIGGHLLKMLAELGPVQRR